MLATVAEAQRDRAEAEGWTTNTELLAGLVELVDYGNRMFHAAHMKGDPPEPVQINRPGRGGEQEAPRTATAAEMKAFFGGGVQYTP